MILRTPQGKFCDSTSLAWAWVPWILDRAWWSPLPDLLGAAAKWCAKQAADATHSEALHIESENFRMAEWHAGQAAKFLAWREVLLDAQKRIGEASR